MHIHSSIRTIIIWLFIANLPLASASGDAENKALDRPADALNTIFHVGLWVEDAEEMLTFLNHVMDINIISRSPRASGGERLMLRDSRGQQMELLSDPENVKPHPDFQLHPQGRTAGVAHIAIWVEDVTALKVKLTAAGYEVLAQVPKDYDDGYVSAGDKQYRILFVRGPSAVTFELFETKI